MVNDGDRQPSGLGGAQNQPAVELNFLLSFYDSLRTRFWTVI